jgi:alpha-1,3-rhamnosyl/mannosyltransferase
MRIAYGTTVLQRALREDSLDGIGRYVGELRNCLQRHEDLEISPFVFSGSRLRLNQGEATTDAGPFLRQAAYSLATNRDFPVTAKTLTGGTDLIHATDHFIPKIHGIPVVATLQDAIPLSHPEWIGYSFKTLKNALWRRSAQWADHVLTISQASKSEIVKWFGLPEEKITVTPLGVGQWWFDEVSREELARVRRSHQLPEHYFLFVGTLQPRKNLRRIIEAHRTLPASVRRQVPLVVAGRAGWNCEADIAELEHGDEGTLRWLRHVPEADLLPLYKQSVALVLPSLHEGFGLPVLEAFAAGLPVVTSNTTSLPEVAGDAALLVNPCEVGEIAVAMRACLNNRDLGKSLAGKGRERAVHFTWEHTAATTMEVYRQVLKGSGVRTPRANAGLVGAGR